MVELNTGLLYSLSEQLSFHPKNYYKQGAEDWFQGDSSESHIFNYPSPVWLVLDVEWSDFVCHRFFDLFEKYGGYQVGHLKLKRPKQLQEVLDIARFLLAEVSSHQDPEIEEKQSKLEQLKAVLEMYVLLSFYYFGYLPESMEKSRVSLRFSCIYYVLVWEELVGLKFALVYFVAFWGTVLKV